MKNKLSPSVSRNLIQQINRMDLGRADYEYIKQCINKLIIGLSLTAIMPPPETRLYRGIIYKTKPSKTSQLGYPPKEIINNFQRCNPPGTPMFYCSPDPCASVYELNTKPGDVVYLSKWSVRKQFFINRIAPKEIDAISDASKDIVFTFFETLFLRRIHEVYSSEYKLTAVIAENLTSGHIAQEYITTKLGGLTYPSVAHPSRSENLAIQPNIADECLQLDHVEEMLITDVSENSINVQYTDFSSNFDHGNIGWTGRVMQWKLPPKSTMTITREHDGWIARDENGNIVKPE